MKNISEKARMTSCCKTPKYCFFLVSYIHTRWVLKPKPHSASILIIKRKISAIWIRALLATQILYFNDSSMQFVLLVGLLCNWLKRWRAKVGSEVYTILFKQDYKFTRYCQASCSIWKTVEQQSRLSHFVYWDC